MTVLQREALALQDCSPEFESQDLHKAGTWDTTKLLSELHIYTMACVPTPTQVTTITIIIMFKQRVEYNEEDTHCSNVQTHTCAHAYMYIHIPHTHISVYTQMDVLIVSTPEILDILIFKCLCWHNVNRSLIWGWGGLNKRTGARDGRCVWNWKTIFKGKFSKLLTLRQKV